MAHLGKFLKAKTLKKVDDYLAKWIDDDEEIIAVFSATRMKSRVGGLVLTNRRLLTVDTLISKINKVVDEIAVDDILEFALENGTGKAMKLFVLKKNGEKVYIGSMYREDALVSPSFLPRMSGTSRPLAERKNIVGTKHDVNNLPTIIIVAILGTIILFVFPPLLVPFLVGALVGLAFKRKKS